MIEDLEKIVVIGGGGHAKVIIDIIERERKYQIAGVVDDGKEKGTEIFGYKVIGQSDKLADLMQEGINSGIIAIGDNWTRSKVANKVLENTPEFQFVNAIHPMASIGRGTTLGQGNVVMANVAINSDTKIGNHCILNTKCSVDHDCNLEDYVSIAPGATLGGNCQVGKFSAISLGANVIHGRNIGEQTIVGAGAVVTKDLPSYKVACGIPARSIKSRKEGDKYL